MRYTHLVLILAAMGLANLVERSQTEAAVGADQWSSNNGPKMTLLQIEALLRDKLTHYPASKAGHLARHVRTVAKRYRFDPSFILAVVEAESGFHSSVVSHMGAIGLMQVLPDTARDVARSLRMPFRGPKDLMDPFYNLTVGVAYLAFLRDRYQGSHELFLSAYNAGLGTVDRFLDEQKFHRLKTRHYVEKIRKLTPTIRAYGRVGIQA